MLIVLLYHTIIYQSIEKEDIIMTYTEHPKFTGRNVPIMEIARATGKNPQFIRIGLQRGLLPFGIAMKNEGSSEYTYYCSDKLVWEATGYFNEKAALDE